MHRLLPDSILIVVLVPVVKDKTGNLSSPANNRTVSLAGVLSKGLEHILLDRLQQYSITTGKQLGFKSTHRTDFCVSIILAPVCTKESILQCVYVCWMLPQRFTESIMKNHLSDLKSESSTF